MRFSMLGVTALTLTGLFGADAEACGRRKARNQCCPAPVAVSSCCGGGYHAGHAYGPGAWTNGYAVAPNAWVNPQPMTMPSSGTVTTAEGTTTNTAGGIVQTSGTTGMVAQPVPVQGVAMTSYAGTYSSDCGCETTGTGRRRGLFRR